MFIETHELLRWRCRACEIRDAKVADAMKKKGSTYGVQYRWFPIGEEFTGHIITREDRRG
jgi:hypothetical protein